MFGAEPFAELSVSTILIELGPLEAEVSFFTLTRAKFNDAPTYNSHILFNPGNSAKMFVDNDTDIIVSNLIRSRDQSPINDASLFASLVFAATNPPITNATNASPIVITSAAHGLTTGEEVFINGVEGNLAANNVHTVTVIDANSFSLDASTGDGVYVTGGKWWKGVPGALELPLEYQEDSNGTYVVTVDAAVPMPAGSYLRFITCDNYNIRFGPTPFTATVRT